MGKNSKVSKKRLREKQHSRRAMYLMAGALVIVLIVAATLGWAILRPRPFTVALIGLEGRRQEAFKTLLGEMKPDCDVRFLSSFEELGTSLHRSNPFSRSPDLLIGPAGMALESRLSLLMPLPSNILGLIPRSLRYELRGEDSEVAVPLLVDRLELAHHTMKLPAMDPNLNLRSLSQVLTGIAGRVGGQSMLPLLISGGDDELLLQVLSAATLELGGETGYRQATAAIRSGMDAGSLASQDIAFGAALSTLREWKDSGLLHREWTRFGLQDQVNILSAERAIAVLQSLGIRRRIPYQIIFNYRSAAFPPKPDAETGIARRVVVAPRIVAAIPLKSRNSEASLKLLADLGKGDAPLRLAEASGLAGAWGAGRQPDVQAAETLSYAANAAGVVDGFFHDAFPTPAAAAAFAESVRHELE